MISKLFNLLKGKSYSLNLIYINKNQLIKNYLYLKSLHENIQIAPVLKSNAYGHGIKEMGEIIDDLNPPFICVDSLYEAYQLTNAGIKSDVLIMGYVDPQNLIRKKLAFSFAVWDLSSAKALNKYQKGASIHIFVDTGMHREGVLLEDLENFIDALKRFENLNIKGLMSHLAMADKPSHSLTKLQIKNFKKAKEICKKKGLTLDWFHFGGGVANLTIEKLPCNIIRTGKILYGVGTLTKNTGLKPVMKITTRLVQIKKIRKGSKVGYDGTYEAKKDMIIGILPLGYNDGLDRRLSSKGVVLVDGTFCSIIGRISMNLTTIYIDKVNNPTIGQEVVVYSDNSDDLNSIQNAASVCGTTPYVLLVNLDSSTKRIIV